MEAQRLAEIDFVLERLSGHEMQKKLMFFVKGSSCEWEATSEIPMCAYFASPLKTGRRISLHFRVLVLN